MFAIEHVIVPFAFSKRCRAASVHAAAIARRFEAKLVFLHVIPYSNYEYAAFEGGAYAGASWPSEAEMRGKLEEEIQSLLPGEKGEAEILIERGDPPGKIEEVAGRLRAPLVVLPTHGFGPFRRFLLGSVTTKVLHDLTCPVYTGAHIEDDPIFARAEARHVACAIDLREHSEAVLTWAWAYAQRWSAAFTVIHAVNWLETGPLDENLFTAKLTERLLAGADREARELMAKVGCGGDLRMQVEAAEDYIPQAVRECGADVLVIGRSLERGMVGRLREHSYKLIRESPVPVISV